MLLVGGDVDRGVVVDRDVVVVDGDADVCSDVVDEDVNGD